MEPGPDAGIDDLAIEIFDRCIVPRCGQRRDVLADGTGDVDRVVGWPTSSRRYLLRGHRSQHHGCLCLGVGWLRGLRVVIGGSRSGVSDCLARAFLLANAPISTHRSPGRRPPAKRCFRRRPPRRPSPKSHPQPRAANESDDCKKDESLVADGPVPNGRPTTRLLYPTCKGTLPISSVQSSTDTAQAGPDSAASRPSAVAVPLPPPQLLCRATGLGNLVNH